MASLYDFDFTGDGGGPDTDPTPDGDEFSDGAPDGVPDDVDNYQEPGVGNSFDGQDPTVFAAEGDPDEPEAQIGPVPTTEAENQSAPGVNDPHSLGQEDDPEAVENETDEQVGDDEEDSSDPANILPRTGHWSDLIRYPEQGIDSDELTVKTPEQVESVVPEAVPEAEINPHPVVEEAGSRIDQLVEDILREGGLANYLQYLGKKIHGDWSTDDEDQMLGDEIEEIQELFEDDLVESTLEGADLFEPSDTQQEFNEVYWPTDDGEYIDLVDFVDLYISNTSAPDDQPSPAQLNILNSGQPVRLWAATGEIAQGLAFDFSEVVE